MIPLELLILIAQICSSSTSSTIDINNSTKCNQYMIACVPKEYARQMIKSPTMAFNKCYIDYEVSK